MTRLWGKGEGWICWISPAKFREIILPPFGVAVYREKLGVAGKVRFRLLTKFWLPLPPNHESSHKWTLL